MSKLGDAIRRSQRIEATPMGFGAARPAQKPSMLVGFVGKSSDAAAARDAGAEVVLIDAHTQEVSADEASKLRQAAGELPAGVWAKSGAADRTKALHEAGVDFLIFDADSTPATALLEEDMGYVLILPDKPEELFLRSLEPLQLEAILVTKIPSSLTVADQIDISRAGGLARKPLLAQVEGDIDKNEAQALRAAGIVALLTDSAANVARLKETVAAIPPRKPRRDDRPVVSLPRGQAAAPEEEDDDDDDGRLSGA